MSAAISRKIYQALLLLHPADVRREFGDEMVSMFEECSATQGCWLVFADTVWSAVKQHVSHFSTTTSRDDFAYADLGCSPDLPRILAITVLMFGLIAGVLGHGGESRDSWTMARVEVRFWFPTGIAVVERNSNALGSWRILRTERSYGK